LTTDEPDGSDAQSHPSLNDELNRIRYTMSPTLYTDEDSTVNELLWQLVLEVRAVRHWIIVACVMLALPLVYWFVALLIVRLTS
jgi:hypothetical protein